MNSSHEQRLMELADELALGIQHVRAEGKIPPGEILLNLDYSTQARSAPFVFDMVCGVLHRNGCKAIPPGSESALYALEEINDSDAPLCCPVCRPDPMPTPVSDPEETFDVLYGVLSFLDQFSSVLTERGREYRTSNRAGAWIDRLEQSLIGVARSSSVADGPPNDARLSTSVFGSASSGMPVVTIVL